VKSLLLLAFCWLEPNYYKSPGTYLCGSQERTPRIVGIAEHQGDALTFLLQKGITEHVIVRSELRPTLYPDNPNLSAEYPNSKANLHSDGREALYPAKPIMSSSDVSGLNTNPSDLK
jgi:hypothetical protein